MANYSMAFPLVSRFEVCTLAECSCWYGWLTFRMFTKLCPSGFCFSVGASHSSLDLLCLKSVVLSYYSLIGDFEELRCISETILCMFDILVLASVFSMNADGRKLGHTRGR